MGYSSKPGKPSDAGRRMMTSNSSYGDLIPPAPLRESLRDLIDQDNAEVQAQVLRAQGLRRVRWEDELEMLLDHCQAIPAREWLDRHAAVKQAMRDRVPFVTVLAAGMALGFGEHWYCD